MSKEYLQSNEKLIMEMDSVSNSKNDRGELILTNTSLIWISRNMFGKIKELKRDSLKTITTFNDSPSVLVERQRTGVILVEINFKDKIEVYRFSSYDEIEAKKMANSINHILTGSIENIYSLNKTVPLVAFATETFKDSLATFKNVLNSTTNAIDEKRAIKMSKKCDSCSAPISGIKGKVVNCNYCNTNQKL